MKTTQLLKSTLIIVFLSSVSFGFAQNNKRILADFNTIKINSTTVVYYVLGNENSISIEPSTLNIENVSTDIDDGTLNISLKKSIDNSTAKIIVTSKNLEQIKAKGISKFITENEISLPKLKVKADGASVIQLKLKTNDINVNLDGASSIDLSGTANLLTAEMDGTTILNALDFTVTDANISVSGASKANVNVKNELTGTINDLSNISYKEEPLKKNINRLNQDISEDIDLGNAVHPIYNDKKGDTTHIRFGNKKITIIDDKDIYGEKKDTIKKKVNNKFNGHWAGIEIGINGYLNSKNSFAVPAGYEYLSLQYEKSCNVNLNFFDLNFNLINNHFGLVTGLGFEYNNYRFDKAVVINPDSSYIYGSKVENFKNLKSKLVVNYLTIPLFFEYQTNNKNKVNSFHISVGAELGIRASAHFKHTWATSDDQYHLMKISDDFYLNDYKLNALVRIGWGKLNFYGTYSLTPLFKDYRGPQLYPFTAGITLAGW